MFYQIPTGWTLANLINLEPGWQANLHDETYVVVATGDTIESALANAAEKAEIGNYLGTRVEAAKLRNKAEESAQGLDLLRQLGLGKPNGHPLVKGTIGRRI